MNLEKIIMNDKVEIAKTKIRVALYHESVKIHYEVISELDQDAPDYANTVENLMNNMTEINNQLLGE